MVPVPHGRIVRRTERSGRRDDDENKKAAGKSWHRKLKFFVVNVTIQYIIWGQDLAKKQQKSVFYTTVMSPRRKLLSEWPLGANGTP